MIEPRWLDTSAAAAYLALDNDAFLRAVKAGICPQPSRHLGLRSPRWDRQALDAAMRSRFRADVESALKAMAEDRKRRRTHIT